MTVIMDMAAEADGASGADHTALSGIQTKLILEKDAEVTLVQIIRNDNAKTVLNDIGAKVQIIFDRQNGVRKNIP